jgi:hypothetical protein
MEPEDKKGLVKARRALRLHLLIALLSAIAIATVVLYVFLVVSKGELGEARGWTVLQSLEVRHRADSDSRTSVLLFNPLGSDFVVLGVPTDNAVYPRTWIVLNKTTPRGEVYMLPKDQRIRLSCAYFGELHNKIAMAQSVSELLGAQCALTDH